MNVCAFDWSAYPGHQRAVEAERLIAGVRKKLSRLPFEQKRVILEELGVRVKVNGREFTVSYSID